MHIIGKKANREVAHQLELFDGNMETDFEIFDKNGQKIIKKMDYTTFKLKFG